MDYIVGRGGLACEFETYFGSHKFLEIHKTDSGKYDCRVFNDRYETDGEEYKPDLSVILFCLGLEAKK